MTTLDDWPRVKRVLAEALEREGGERRSYLDEACGSDAQLRARIETLPVVRRPRPDGTWVEGGRLGLAMMAGSEMALVGSQST